MMSAAAKVKGAMVWTQFLHSVVLRVLSLLPQARWNGLYLELD